MPRVFLYEGGIAFELMRCSMAEGAKVSQSFGLLVFSDGYMMFLQKRKGTAKGGEGGWVRVLGSGV